MKNLFDKRSLSRVQAKAIADSQHDLGGKSKEHMAIALGGFAPAKDYDELLAGRISAYEKLDPLTQFIVKEFLGNQSIEQSIDNINYAIANLKSAVESVKLEVE